MSNRMCTASKCKIKYSLQQHSQAAIICYFNYIRWSQAFLLLLAHCQWQPPTYFSLPRPFDRSFALPYLAHSYLAPYYILVSRRWVCKRIFIMNFIVEWWSRAAVTRVMSHLCSSTVIINFVIIFIVKRNNEGNEIHWNVQQKRCLCAVAI